jgi:hypothetical protein
MFPFDRDQFRNLPARDDAVLLKRLEGVMKKFISRTAAPRSAYWQEDFVALWSTSMWILAAIYLLATFSIY